SAAAFPLNLSPSILSVKSRGNSLSMNFRTAENVRVLAFSFTSLSFSPFWSGQVIVPASLSPSFLIVISSVRIWSPILYSHFHVPPGSALAPCAPPSPQSPSTNVAERTPLRVASKKWGGEAVRHGPASPRRQES